MQFGIIGTNFVADWFINGAKHDPRFVLGAIYSRSRETAQNFLKKHQISEAEIFTDFAAFSVSNCFDAAYISSPNILHHSQAVQLMANGKHVLCEKPMGTNLRETEFMTQAAADNGVILMEAVKTTLLPNFGAVRNALPRIGIIRRYFSQYCQYSSRYDALKSGTVMNAFDASMAGGALLDLGIYCLYPMVVLFGKPKSVTSQGMLLHTGVDGQGTIIAQYDGFDAVSLYSKISDSTLPTEIQGELGSIVIEKINTFSKVLIHFRNGAIEDISQSTNSDNMYYEIAHFINRIELGLCSPINSPQTSLCVAELMSNVRSGIGVCYPND